MYHITNSTYFAPAFFNIYTYPQFNVIYITTITLSQQGLNKKNIYIIISDDHCIEAFLPRK